MKTKYHDLVLFDQKIIDIHETNRRLLESQYVHFINYNQIKQLLSGNKKSLMYGRIAHLHQDLWGKYPEIHEGEIKYAMENYVITSKQEKVNPPRDIFKDPPIIDDKYSLFCNVDGAKTFTLEYLDSLADWDTIPEGIKDNEVKKTLPIDGVDIPFYSNPEYKTYIALRSKKLIKHFRVQSLKITHSTYQGKLKPYYPDFVFLTPEGYIAIVESKPIVDMSNFYNRCKYYALKLYCESMGFIYAMVDENLVSLESILQRKVTNNITKAFDEILEKTGQFSTGDLKFIFEKHKSSYKQIEIREILSRHIAQKNLLNKAKYGFEIKSEETIDFDQL
jgi:hypothetical protein